MRVLVVWIVAVTEMKPIGGKMRQCVTTLMFVDDRNIDRAQNRAQKARSTGADETYSAWYAPESGVSRIRLIEAIAIA